MITQRPLRNLPQRFDGICHLRRFIAVNDPAFFRPVFKQAVESHRFQHLRNMDEIALLRRFYGIGSQPLRIHTFRHRVIGEHRAQTARAHFRGLLHHVIEAGVLQRGEHVVDIRRWRRIGELLLACQLAALAGAGDNAEPFPVSAVEEPHPVALAQAHDVVQIVALSPLRSDGGAGIEGGFDVKPGNACDRGHEP